jgi:hypothetical protein
MSGPSLFAGHFFRVDIYLLFGDFRQSITILSEKGKEKKRQKKQGTRIS